MTTYTLTTSERGQTLDHVHFDSERCLLDRLAAMGLRADTAEGVQFHGDGFRAEHGAEPGGCQTDYDTYCETCLDWMWHGLQCTEDCAAEFAAALRPDPANPNPEDMP